MSTSVTICNQEYFVLSPDEPRQIALRIVQQMQDNRHSFEYVLALAKGGVIFARYITDYLGMSQMFFLTLQSYIVVGERDEQVNVQEASLDHFQGKQVLVIDDLVDTGNTFTAALDRLQNVGAKVVTATICTKPHSIITPDYYGCTTSAWVIFPWEARETMTLLLPKWQHAGLSEEEIRSHFHKLGFSDEEMSLIW